MSDATLSHDYGPDDARADLGALAAKGGDARAAARLGAYLSRLEELKAAGDVLIREASQPTRKGSQMLNALVEYRRISEAL